MKRDKIIFYVTTGLLSALMLLSAGMYFFNNAEVSASFQKLGFPTFVIYPLAILKLLGIVAIWTRKSAALVEWAYAGFFFNFVLALTAHINISDGEFGGAAMAIVLLLTSYFFGKKAFA